VFVDWNLLLTTVVGSGAGFAVVTLIFEQFRYKEQRTETAGYLALQLAFNFEAFASQCSDVVSDDELAEEHDGHVGKRIGGVPPFAALPESEAYKLLQTSLLHEVMEFPQRRELAQQRVSFWWDVVGDDDSYKGAAVEQTLLLGDRALKLAKRLRQTYRLPSRDFNVDDWNLETHLDKKAREVKENQRRREQPSD